MTVRGFYLNGVCKTNATLDVRNKHTGEVFARVSVSDKEHVDTAYKVASNARTLSIHKRAEILDKASEIVLAKKKELSETICLEAGKPIALAEGEVSRCAQTLKFSASVARTLSGKTINFEAHSNGCGRRGYVSYEPVGTVAAISPFNFPLNLYAHKIGPAVAAGCPIVSKPASTTPLSALMLAEILFEAGLPYEHLSVLIGSGKTIGEGIATHKDCKHISFTGSPDVGWHLVETNPTIDRTLELGSNSAMIADSSWDTEDIAKKAVSASMAYSGQICISLQRLYLTKEIFKEVIKEVVGLAKELTIGDPMDRNTKIGPMISRQEADRIREWVGEAVSFGAKLIHSSDSGGAHLGAQILTHVPEDVKLIQNEAFGPVLCINPVDSLEEAVQKINATKYGLQAGILVSDYRKAIKLSEALDVAGVVIGDSPIFRVDNMPYGGIKHSGVGREGPEWAIRDLVREKLTVFTL